MVVSRSRPGDSPERNLNTRRLATRGRSLANSASRGRTRGSSTRLGRKPVFPPSNRQAGVSLIDTVLTLGVGTIGAIIGAGIAGGGAAAGLGVAGLLLGYFLSRGISKPPKKISRLEMAVPVAIGFIAQSALLTYSAFSQVFIEATKLGGITVLILGGLLGTIGVGLAHMTPEKETNVVNRIFSFIFRVGVGVFVPSAIGGIIWLGAQIF